MAKRKFKVKATTTERTKRTDHILHLVQTYSGALDTPVKYNTAFANVLRLMAKEIENIKDAWVDPEVVVWMHEQGRIQAEVPLSDPSDTSP